jgi:SAM-dependent methyltransferase
MLFLTAEESRTWKDLADKVLKTRSGSNGDLDSIRPGLIPAFHYYIGTLLLSQGYNQEGATWIHSGIAVEPGGLFSNAFLASYLQRNHGALVIPEVIFSDPAPYVHFSSTPLLTDSRARFMTDCARGLPRITQPLKIMDIGCGHGKAVVDLLLRLRSEGLIDAVEEIFLIDPSEGMLKLAKENVAAALPGARIRISQSRFEALSDHLQGHYHMALSSLAYHHMPYETKLIHMKKLRDHIDHFILYEVDANNDTPELHSPEIALSVYQAYGILIDCVFANDAPIDLAISSIDKFLMSEAIYFFTEPRGKRTDYHMLRSQWHQLFHEGLGKDFSCLCDSTDYADEHVALFTMIYGR